MQMDEAKSCTAAQLSLAWLLTLSITPLPIQVMKMAEAKSCTEPFYFSYGAFRTSHYLATTPDYRTANTFMNLPAEEGFVRVKVVYYFHG